MAIYSVQRKTEGFVASFRVCDARDVSVGSCDQFLTELSQRDCSAYTQRAYAIGLAHFFSWLHHVDRDPDHVTRQIVGSYIADVRNRTFYLPSLIASSQRHRQANDRNGQ